MATDEEKEKNAIKKEAKRLRLRGASIKELVLTEVQYVKDLEILTEVYINPLKTNNIINAEQHRLLFNNIPALIKLNSQFSDGLSLRYNSDWDPATSKIAGEFLQFAPYFHMYQGYLNSHEQAAGLVSKLYIRSSKFKKFVDAAQFNPKCKGLDLKSYLVKPLQRITKYTLLLRELIKHTLDIHPDYTDLQQAMLKINEVNITINDKMKTFDQRQKVRDIQARFTQNVDLVSPARYFIKEGKLTKICRKKDIGYIFILFSDLLIYGEKAGHDNNQIKIHQQIPINQSFRIRDIPQNIKYGAKCWEIHSPEKSFIVYADHPGLKQEWYFEMKKVVDLRSTIESGKQRPAALWVPDDFTTHCMMTKCEHKFNVINRRHHCRYCGRLVCGPCSTQKLPHFSKRNKSVRVCRMCYDENKELQNYAAKMKEKNKKNAKKDKLIQGILEDEDSMSVGSDVDFEFWDSDEIEDDVVNINSNNNTDYEEEEGDTGMEDNIDSQTMSDNEAKRSESSTKIVQRKSGKMKKKTKRKQQKQMHLRSASLGCAQDLENKSTSNHNGIFSNSAKIFRLQYSHTPKKSTRTLYELANLSVLQLNGDKRNSGSLSSLPSMGTSPIMGYSQYSHSVSHDKNVLDMDDTEMEKKTSGNLSYDAYTKTNTNLGHINGKSSLVLPPILLSAGNLSNTMSVSASPRNSGSANRRLKLIGTGTLHIEAHQYDHELVSMRLHTFTEVIDWNLDPHSMKPKKKDDFSCYLKALNVLSQQNEILLIRIKNKDIMDSLLTILLSLSYYYEAENANRDDDDMDSDADASVGTSTQTVSLSKDTTLEEHKAEIDRAVFLIENSKKHDNIKTLDVAKFLLAKSCPISVIQLAFDKTGVIMPEEVYELAGVVSPRKKKMNRKLKKWKSKEKKLNKNGKRAAKASKLLGTGFHRESVMKKMSKRVRSNSGDFGKREKYKKKYGGDKYKSKKLIKIELKQSQSDEAKDYFGEDEWLPPYVKLPDADTDLRYQEALYQHDIRFHINNGNNLTLPSDKLDSQLRIVINYMSGLAKSHCSAGSSSPISLNHLSTKLNKDKKEKKLKRKSKSKFSALFGNKKHTDT